MRAERVYQVVERDSFLGEIVVGYGDATWSDGGDVSLEGNVLWVWGLVAEDVG